MENKHEGTKKIRVGKGLDKLITGLAFEPNNKDMLADFIINTLRAEKENSNLSKDEVIERATLKIKSYIDENYHHLVT